VRRATGYCFRFRFLLPVSSSAGCWRLPETRDSCGSDDDDCDNFRSTGPTVGGRRSAMSGDRTGTGSGGVTSSDDVTPAPTRLPVTLAPIQLPITMTLLPVTPIQLPLTSTSILLSVTLAPIQFSVAAMTLPITPIQLPVTSTRFPVSLIPFAVARMPIQLPVRRSNLRSHQKRYYFRFRMRQYNFRSHRQRRDFRLDGCRSTSVSCRRRRGRSRLVRLCWTASRPRNDRRDAPPALLRTTTQHSVC